MLFRFDLLEALEDSALARKAGCAFFLALSRRFLMRTSTASSAS